MNTDLKPHEYGLWIIDNIEGLMANLQATLPEHKARLEALQFLRQRLQRLNLLEATEERRKEIPVEKNG